MIYNFVKYSFCYFQMDLSSFINKSQCECLNESDDHPLAHAFAAKGGFLESDCDEQVKGISGHLIFGTYPCGKGLFAFLIFV